jgi:hypothetical protein
MTLHLPRWLVVVTLGLVLSALSFCSKVIPIPVPIGVVLYAQALPATVHVLWNPNPASDNVTQYQVQLDTGAVVVVLPTVCTATLCTSPAISVPAFGAHIVKLTAGNLRLSADPTSLQFGPTVTLAFTVNPMPNAIVGGTVTN